MSLRVLFVDDESRVLDAFQRLLRPMRLEWETFFATSGRDALDILARQRFDAIVTDMRMPEMDGATLLRLVMRDYPYLLRLILSGHSDLESVVKAAGVAHQYLAKPCTLEHLRTALTHSYNLRKVLCDAALTSLFSGIEAIPTVPRVYTELMGALESPNCGVAEIGQIVARDPGMTAKVLQFANSAYFNTGSAIASPAEAVNRLGATTIKALVLTAHIVKVFAAEGTLLSADQFLAHSLHCSRLAREFACSARPADGALQEFASVAGLLHDVGRLLLASRLPDRYAAIVALSARKGLSHWESEREILGVSHAEAGACVLARWGLPNEIVEAVAYHHAPGLCSNGSFSALTAVHLANTAIRGNEPPGPFSALPDAAYIARAGAE